MSLGTQGQATVANVSGRDLAVESNRHPDDRIGGTGARTPARHHPRKYEVREWLPTILTPATHF